MRTMRERSVVEGAMTECFVGEIMLVPYARGAPTGWLACDGSLLQISNGDYQPLYQLIGTTYGGDGQSTFALPDLRGRVPLHAGQGANLSNYALGQAAGSEQVTLTIPNMPTHNHPMMASSPPGTSSTPIAGGALASLASGNSDAQAYVAPSGGQTNLVGSSIGMAGGSQPHPNVQPSVGLRYIICYAGIFPSRP